MTIYIRKVLLYLILFTPTILFSQHRDTTITTFDALTGIKKVIQYEFIGSGGGYSGAAPHLTKTTITKYDKNGKIIYLSHKTRRLRGCIADYPNWDIMAIDSLGGQQRLKFKRRGKFVIKLFDRNGKLISKTISNWTNARTLYWIDKDE